MAGYDPTNYENQLNSNNRGLFNRFLRKVTSWGRETDYETLKNSIAIGINQLPTSADMNSMDLFSVMSRNATSKLLETKNIALLDRSYPEKRRILREYSIKDEIRDYVNQICYEAIMYDDNHNIAVPIDLPNEFSNKNIREKFSSSYDEIYRKLDFKNGLRAWTLMRKFIVDGYIALEIIYDDRMKDILGFQELDPTSLLQGTDPLTFETIWIQFPSDPNLRRVLLDSQIIYISYSAGQDFIETSYIEYLIRPYNQLKLLEQSRVMWNLINAQSRMIFKIPVGDTPLNKSQQAVSEVIADYKDEVTWDDSSGTPRINGSPHIPYFKEYWFPESAAGSPSVEMLEGGGPNLNDNDTLTWFYNILKRASKIPFSRFDKDNGGGNIFGDTTDTSRDELNFHHFIQTIRTNWKEILIKPWKIKMALEFPELLEDKNFMDNFNIKFNGINLYYEWKELANTSKRLDIITNLLNLKQFDPVTQQEKSYFHTEFLIKKYLHYTDEEIAENRRFNKELPEINASVPQDSGFGSGFGMGSSSGGGQDFGSDLPDTLPASPEPVTTGSETTTNETPDTTAPAAPTPSETT